MRESRKHKFSRRFDRKRRKRTLRFGLNLATRREPGRTPFNNPKTAQKIEGTSILTFYAVLDSSRRAASDGTGPIVWRCLVPKIFQFENMKLV